jgi:hypothetical protein
MTRFWTPEFMAVEDGGGWMGHGVATLSSLLGWLAVVERWMWLWLVVAEVVVVMVGEKEIVCTWDVWYLFVISHQKYTTIL